jgi:hypothetical protein
MNMTEAEFQDLEEAHYYWVLSEILDMIEKYGYTLVMQDIDRGLIQRGVQE